MSDKKIQDLLKEKPKLFYKKILKRWGFSLVYSVTFVKWMENEESWLVEEVDTYSKKSPKIANTVANIITTLQEDFPDTKYDYGNDTYLSLAIIIHKKHMDRLWKYAQRKSLFPKTSPHTEKEAFRELVFQGYVPLALTGFHPKKDIYLKGNVGNLAFPVKFKTPTEGYEWMERFGVMGYSGVNVPEKL